MPNSVRLNQDYPVIDRSRELLARSEGLIPAHTQTLAKGPGQHVRGVAPVYLDRGSGSRVWDVDGNEYIDLTMAVGPLSLGYAYPRVDEAVRRQLEKGMSFSLVHPLEVEVSELVREVVPGVEMVRFSKTGCDVTTAAVRAARAFTGREKVLCCGYHGWHDWYVAVTDRNRGVPGATVEMTHTFRYDDPEHLEASIGEDTACVILEPVVFQEPSPGYLAEVRRICDRHGVLLIFDEMWTGFRVALGGAQERYDVRADLVTFSKAVANGMPLSILAGRREVMQLLDRDVFFFTTFGGETLSLAAARATMEELREKRVPENLARVGRGFKDGFNQTARELEIDYTRCVGLDCRTLVTFDAAAGDPLVMKSLVQQEMLRHGVLWSGFHNVSYSHHEKDVEHVVAAYRESLGVLRQAVEEGNLTGRLRGEAVEPVFRKTHRFNTRPREKSPPKTRESVR